MMDCDTAQETLTARLAELGFSLEALNHEERPGWGDKYAGHVTVKIKRKGLFPELVTPYSAGAWHVIRWAKRSLLADLTIPMRHRATVRRMKLQGGLCVDEADAMKAIRLLWVPELVDVFGSLLMDYGGWEADQSFRDWCENYESEYGKWEESPAKALDMYEALQRTARFLVRVLTPDELTELGELAHEL